jgi:hypothetical protein
VGLTFRGSDVIDGFGKRFGAARSDRHLRTTRREEHRKKSSKTARTAGYESVLAA